MWIVVKLSLLMIKMNFSEILNRASAGLHLPKGSA